MLLDLYELTMAQAYFVYKPQARATFDLFVRRLPKNRSFLVACGLEDILQYIKNWKLSASSLDYLRSLGTFSEEFLEYLCGFKFSGDVFAMPEGEIFFADEPVIRVTAPIIEAQILESFLLNTINLQSAIASKAVRVVLSANKRVVFDFSLRRTHGFDAALHAARSSYIAGCYGTSNCLAGKLYGIPIAGTMAHSFVLAFKNELDSFLAYAETFPKRSVLLVDTYDTKNGIKNAITIGLYLKEKKYNLSGIRLDSGDIVSLSKYARVMLDKAGLKYVKIFASGNLDEFKIRDLLRRGACVDNFGVGTNMGTSIDAPSLDVIYKISEVTDASGKFIPAMKLSKAKVTYPGRKQVFRVQNNSGKFTRDILGIAGEGLPGKQLLKKVIGRGRIIYKSPGVKKIREFTHSNLDKFPSSLKNISGKYKYPVLISPKLRSLRSVLSQQLRNNKIN